MISPRSSLLPFAAPFRSLSLLVGCGPIIISVFAFLSLCSVRFESGIFPHMSLPFQSLCSSAFLSALKLELLQRGSSDNTAVEEAQNQAEEPCLARLAEQASMITRLRNENSDHQLNLRCADGMRDAAHQALSDAKAEISQLMRSALASAQEARQSVETQCDAQIEVNRMLHAEHEAESLHLATITVENRRLSDVAAAATSTCDVIVPLNLSLGVDLPERLQMVVIRVWPIKLYTTYVVGMPDDFKYLVRSLACCYSATVHK